MRATILLALTILVISGCNHSNKSTPAESPVNDITSATTNRAPEIELNKISLHGNICRIDTISKAEFEAIKGEANLDTSELKRLLDDAEHVAETPRGLRFKLSNGDTFLLKNVISYPNPTDSTMIGDDYLKYDFEKNYTGTNYWGVGGQFYEGGSYFVDKRSGKVNCTFGLPVISSNKKLFVAAYYDMTDESPSGIGLYRHGKDSLETIFSVEPGWTMGEIKWKDDNTIYFTQVWYDTLMQSKSRYAKLDLGQLHLDK